MKTYEINSKDTMTKLVVLEYDAVNLTDINNAEQKEADFQNKGYSYYNTECGFLTTRLIFDTHVPCQ